MPLQAKFSLARFLGARTCECRCVTHHREDLRCAKKNYSLLAISSIVQLFVSKIYANMEINAQSASLRSLVAAESKAAEIKAAVACFESVSL